MKLIPLLAIFLAALILPSCNPVKDTAEAEKEVPNFHSLYDAEDYEKIYDTAHPEFQSAQPKAELISFLTGVRGKLGAVKSTSKKGWQANSMNGQTNIVLTYATKFENGEGTETFTYRVKSGKATLLGWFIESPIFLSGFAPSTPANESTREETETDTE